MDSNITFVKSVFRPSECGNGKSDFNQHALSISCDLIKMINIKTPTWV
jgi:hypothetical protein